MNEWILIVVGLALLLGGGEVLVRGAATLAVRLGISPMMIGLTVVGFGTSAPELATSVEAALLGAPEIAVGNVVGSNIANILLILAVAALVCPIPCPRSAIRRDGAVAFLAAALAVAVAQYGSMPRLAGMVFVVLLIAYLIASYRADTGSPSPPGEADLVAPVVHGPAWLSGGFVLGGLFGVIVGAALLVDGATVVARSAGVSETVIGLTLVAVGTSLPELTVSIIAAMRRELDVALGNIIGSNIFNLFGVLGVTAIVHPLEFSPQVAAFDVWVMVGATIVMSVFALTRMRIERWEGAVLLAGYAIYLWAQFDPRLHAALGLAPMS